MHRNVDALRFLDLITTENIQFFDEYEMDALRKLARKAGRTMIYDCSASYPGRTAKKTGRMRADTAYLHNQGRLFSDLATGASEAMGLDESFVVKDYFAVAMLKEITCRNPALVFKGGTCLSKCYGVIDRFSEDVDLGIQEEHATEGDAPAAKSGPSWKARKNSAFLSPTSTAREVVASTTAMRCPCPA